MVDMVQAARWVMTAPNAPFVRMPFDPRAEPEPLAADEVIVQVAGCGVCHTDLGYYYNGVRTNHALPLALGHEISGHVVAAGDTATNLVGRAVIVPAVIPCGTCGPCRRGRPNICRQQKMPGNDIHGGFATHVRVPMKGLCLVDEAKLRTAGLLLSDVAVVADAITTPYQAVTRAGVAPGALAIVVGAGGVGGYCVQVAHAFGANVIAIDIDPTRLTALAQHGAALTLSAREHDAKALKSAVAAHAKQHDLPGTEWFIFECSGTAAGQLTAYGLLVPGATLSIVGFTMEKVELRLSNLMAFDARAIGNWGCPPELYTPALDLVLAGKVQVKPFIESHPLDDINAVFQAVHGHQLSRRAVLVPSH